MGEWATEPNKKEPKKNYQEKAIKEHEEEMKKRRELWFSK